MKIKMKFGIVMLIVLVLGIAVQATENNYYLDTMTTDEADPSDNDCGNSYEDLEYDEDFSDEEERPVFVFGFPRDELPSNVLIDNAVFNVWFDEKYDGGDINIYMSYTQSTDCDSCMDYDDAFDECNIDSGDSKIGDEYTVDEEWFSYEVTDELKSAYNNDRFVAFWMRGNTNSNGGDVKQDFGGEDHSSKAPYLRIRYRERQCSSGVCCDADGFFRLNSYVCSGIVGTRYNCLDTNDVWVGNQYQMCSGISANCNGALSWQGWELYESCDSNEYCFEGSCVTCSSHVEYKCDNGDVYWFDSCENREELKQDCNSNQICVNGGCETPKPFNPKMSVGDYLAWSFDGAFTNVETVDFKDELSKAIEDCVPDAEGYCDIPIKVSSETKGILTLSNLNIEYGEIKDEPDPVCAKDAECGINKWIEGKSCSGNDVWQKYRTYECVNPGTNFAYCAHSDEDIKRYDCSNICLKGLCVDIECYDDSDCGTDKWVGNRYCKNDDVWQDRRIYDCDNAGTVNADCSYDDNDKRKKNCDYGCEQGVCLSSGYVCSSASECGADGLIGSSYCENGDAWRNNREWTCHNSATYDSYCSYADNSQLIEDCEGECVSGACASLECIFDIECSSDEWIGQPYCESGDVWQEYRDWGCNVGTCEYLDNGQLKEDCADGCENGVCSESGLESDVEVSYLLVQHPDNPVAGADIVFAFTIQNTGDVDLENIEWELELGGASVRGVVNGLAAGHGQVVIRKVVYANPGTYYPRVVLDPDNLIDEFNEANNQDEITVVVA